MSISPENCAILAEAIEQTCQTLFITDARGTIIYVNPAFERLTGYSREEALGRNASILKSGEHSADFYAAMWAALRAGKSWRGRLVNRRKDGSTYTDDQRICPVKGENGEIKYFLALRHDITREIQLEEQLAQSQKMESMGLLAGQISHDFNNLLTIIIGSMELISEDLKPGTVGHKLATEILRSSKESTNLIKQLLIFARKQDATPVVVSLNEPVKELKVLFDNLLGRNVSVAYSLADDLVKVKIEPEHFKQAVMNLAINARDAMNGSGAMLVRTYNAGPEGLPPSLPRGVYAVLEVGDTGPGIPKDVLPRMFEPFFTTKPKGKGTGLGLSTVYGIVTQNKGHIFAANSPRGGAVFTVYFPAILA
ncbi:MAG: PAS domain S-box protein [Elusimicrobiales bacterium]|nr:PAS domain S-box protein [Elusimicrobiales bacterium]